MKNKIAIIACIILTIIFVPQSSAVMIGAGPSTIDFGKLVKGGYSEAKITISTSGNEDLTCTIEKTGDIKDWIVLDKGNNVELSSNSRLTIKVTIEPPPDAKNGRYEGAIYIKATPKLSKIDNGTGLTMGAGIKINLKAEITSETIRSFKLTNTAISNTEIGQPILVSATIQNSGNINATPNTKIEIYDLTGKQIKEYSPQSVEIMPTIESSIIYNIPSEGLEISRYNIKIQVENEEQTLSFNLLDKDTLALKGFLKSIELNKIWVEIGETAKITAKIENKGDKVIKGTRFNVEVYMIDEKYHTEKLVKVFSSEDSLDVPEKETAELVAYFTPSSAGQYNIQGAVSYGGKKTEYKSTILNVIERQTNYLPYIIVSLITILSVMYWLNKKGEDGRTQRFKKIWGDYLQLK